MFMSKLLIGHAASRTGWPKKIVNVQSIIHSAIVVAPSTTALDTAR